MRYRRTFTPLVITLAAATPALGQQVDTLGAGRIVGIVFDAVTGEPVSDVAVGLAERESIVVFTGADGRFVLPDVDRGIWAVTLEHVAYGRHEQLVNVPEGRTVDAVFRLAPRAIELDSLVAEVSIRSQYLERQGFYSRRDRGFGKFFNGVQVRRVGVVATLRRVPRLRLAWLPMRRQYVPVFRRGTRNCMPVIVIDGHPIRLGGDLSIRDVVLDSDVGAMEVYGPGETPIEFLRGGRFDDCGAIVVWSAFRSGT